ncbi:hypothetical protein NECAME_07156 [Necator americanus]|uniref:Uncharacterized protein n=1 Tax=Necator americanus TaxID=51031 RepID=W2TQC1_NECAM|nr:hypothetical protein NECAME_07156 [Necator americanus]ETN83864.1 hypothetical protein NECAME_07156 [Necator americanus]
MISKIRKFKKDKSNFQTMAFAPILIETDIETIVSVYKLQYVGGDFKCGQFLDSRNMRLINYIAPPRFVDAKKFKLREMQNDFEYIVILALRARIQFSAAGDPIIESDTVGRIKIDEDWARRSEIPALLPNRAVIEA